MPGELGGLARKDLIRMAAAGLVAGGAAYRFKHVLVREAAYRATSKAVWEIVRSRLDRVQGVGLDEAYAELTGVPKPLRVLRELVAEVKTSTGIQISVGVGPNRLIAKCCSDLGKPAGFVATMRSSAARLVSAVTKMNGVGESSARSCSAT